ncbi:G/U mismatch-specific DNA glycosylase [Heyndrickxia sporothermodurans]|nr:G/U mismatch-specific DNA glycosylase [Heyndrickxia sporothermodurans]
MNPIPDHLKKNLDILFVGFNPSIRSSETGHHFANPNNRFWKILFESGLTPKKFHPDEDYKLLNLGYGMTNIVSRPTKAADEITKEEYQKGKEILKKKITQYQPKVICYVGKGVYQEFSKKKSIPWGCQNEAVVPGTIDFVAPSSSGLVRMKLEEIIEIYRQLSILLNEINNYN